MVAVSSSLSRDEWLALLPRALVAGFVKTDKEFQKKGKKDWSSCGILNKNFYSGTHPNDQKMMTFRTIVRNHSNFCYCGWMDGHCCFCWRFTLYPRFARQYYNHIDC